MKISAFESLMSHKRECKAQSKVKQSSNIDTQDNQTSLSLTMFHNAEERFNVKTMLTTAKKASKHVTFKVNDEEQSGS